MAECRGSKVQREELSPPTGILAGIPGPRRSGWGETQDFLPSETKRQRLGGACDFPPNRTGTCSVFWALLSFLELWDLARGARWGGPWVTGPHFSRAIAAQEAQQGEPWAAALLQLSAGLGPAPPSGVSHRCSGRRWAQVWGPLATQPAGSQGPAFACWGCIISCYFILMDLFYYSKICLLYTLLKMLIFYFILLKIILSFTLFLYCFIITFCFILNLI